MPAHSRSEKPGQFSSWRDTYHEMLDQNLRGQKSFIEQNRENGIGTAIESAIRLAKIVNPMITFVGNEDAASMEFTNLANSGKPGLKNFLDGVLQTIYGNNFKPNAENTEALIKIAQKNGITDVGNKEAFGKWTYHYGFGMKIDSVLHMMEGIGGMDTAMLSELIDIENKPELSPVKKVLNFYIEKPQNN